MSRKYMQRRRAESTDATRRRITEAAIALHTTVGPAATTVSAIAERAGVERVTVYRHFPDETALFRACTTHGWEMFPPPPHERWAKIEDPEERLRQALTELYAYYGRVGEAFLTIIHDFPRVPVLAQLNEPSFAVWTASMRDTLARGWKRRGRRRRLLLAALEHAVDLKTWQSLVRERGLSDADAISLLVRLVRCT
jgi:AcrR family transcriptional regulator